MRYTRIQQQYHTYSNTNKQNVYYSCINDICQYINWESKEEFNLKKKILELIKEYDKWNKIYDT